ncbi:MAG: hypothetical protein V7638_2365 [Acidobacteriota bacterium]|jgi:hypothetical protein
MIVYLYREEAKGLLANLAHSSIDLLEEKLMFLLDLLKEDDWTFVIKAHALIETAVTQMLVEHLGEVELMKIVELLPLSENRTGKIAVARQLKLLDDKQRRFVRFFSELRNSLVHRLDNLNFTFENYVSTLDSNQRRSLKESVAWFADDEQMRKEWEMIAEDNPRVGVYIAIHCLMAHCILSTQQSSALREIDEMAIRTTKELLDVAGRVDT